MGRNLAWSLDEVDYLNQIGGTDHIVILCKKYCRVAAVQKWTKRSHSSIKRKLTDLGYSHKPAFNGWTGSGLARILGVRPNRVNNWCVKKKLVSRKVEGFRQQRILQSDLEIFAREHPLCLRDVDPFNLRTVLDSETVDFILAQEPLIKSISVYSSKTGKVYSSILQASRNEYFCTRTIALAARNDMPTIDGTRFVKLKKEMAA